MADSLTLAGIQTLGYVQGTEQIILGRGGDVGSPTPDTATIASLLLDGDRQTGDRYGNRHFSLPFTVFGGGVRSQVSSELDLLLKATAASTWDMVWYPAGGFQTVWHCYKATPKVHWSPRDQSDMAAAQFTLDFDAQPFGYSISPTSVTKTATGTRGSTFTIPSVVGSARTPVALDVARAGGGSIVDLLLHSPPSTQDPNATIFAPLSSGAVTIAAANMNYKGTYSIVALLSASDTVARTITATIVQKVGSTTVATFTPSVAVSGSQTMVTIGEINLPVVPFPVENVNCSMTITITSTGTDIFSDVALCDTKGQTIILTGLSGLPVSTNSVWVDAPDPLVGVGPVYSSSTTDRTHAINVLKQALISGGPMLFEPGDNKLVAASTSGAPGATVTYTPAWLHEACS